MRESLVMRCTTLVAGIGIGVMLAQSPMPRADAAKAKPSRVVVGLKDPLTPPVIRELRRTFGARLLTIAPGGAYALVLLRPGETLAAVQARSRRIAWVEPEVAMSLSPDARGAALVIPAPRAKR